MPRPRFFCALSLYVPVCCLMCWGQTPAAAPAPAAAKVSDPAVLLHLAESANSLDDPGTGAWRLKASFESLDANGKPLDTGTVEEWHLGPERWKRTYTSSKFKQTEYQTPEGKSYETAAGAPPWPLSLLGRELSHPVARSQIEGSVPQLRSPPSGSAKLSCLVLSLPLPAEAPFGLFPSYCFDPANNMLRLEVVDGTITTARNQMVQFRNVFLPKEIAVVDENRLLLRIHVLEISGMSDSEAASAAPPAAANLIAPAKIKLAFVVANGNKLSGPQPEYPEKAKQQRAQGTVELKVTIGTDGRIEQLRVAYSPADLLTMAAVEAVQQWRYRPVTDRGRPVSVETTILVPFYLQQ
jgi:TonB family protein